MSTYDTLILAGYGTIGRSLPLLAPRTIARFKNIIILDKAPACGVLPHERSFAFRCGDINDLSLVRDMCARMQHPAVFINLATDIDTVALRNVLAAYNVAYIDAGAGLVEGRLELHMQNLMPYCYADIATRRPHLLHFGVNPGLVEIIARKIMRSLPSSTYDIFIFEYDDLWSPESSRPLVGWSPKSLVEEMLVCPSFRLLNGRRVEDRQGPTQKVIARWQGAEIPSRIVGHEEIWNFSLLGNTVNAQFVYGLHPEVMRLLDAGAQAALCALAVPDGQLPIYGCDRLAVQVIARENSVRQTLLWEVDHHRVGQRHRLNAVQYQTGLSLLLAVELLQQTGYGLDSGVFTASSLPISDAQWDMLDSLMQDLGIWWQDGDYLNLGLKENS